MVGGLLVLLVVINIYLIPAWVSTHRRHNNSNAIWVLNIFLGWTVIGWVAALVWASTKDVDKTVKLPVLRLLP